MHVALCAWSDAAACLAEHGKLSPIPILLQGTALQRVTDVALGVAIPVHSHIAINSVLSDYVPKSVMGASRVGALGVTAITLLGFAKLNLVGPGITPTVKKLWRKDPQ
eukprot:jgi/Astpho2/1130/e_gw1.00021.123.1_t